MDNGIDKEYRRQNLKAAQGEILEALQRTIRACSYFDPTDTSDPIVLFLYRAASQLRSAADKIWESLK